jgi:hypothetical protein
MVQVVEHLPYKCEALSSVPITTKNMVLAILKCLIKGEDI